ncbi:MAG: hypothetical protein K1X92_01115 [Bacteroidia bacterium]|nr:hypothetical protein [Bacteroidia bacterium]
MQSEPQKTTNITTYAYDILSPGELQTYLPAWRSVFVTSELSRRKTVQIDSSGTIRYRNEIRPLIPPPQEKSEAETLLWEYMSQLTNNLKEQIAPKGKNAGAEYFPPDFPTDVFSQSNWKILTMEPEAHDKIPGLTRTWKAVLRPVLDAFAEITILGVTFTKKIFLPIEGATLTVRFAGNLVTDLDLASPIALKTTRKTEPLKIASEHLGYVTSEKILEMLEFGFRVVDGGLRVRERREEDKPKVVQKEEIEEEMDPNCFIIGTIWVYIVYGENTLSSQVKDFLAPEIIRIMDFNNVDANLIFISKDELDRNTSRLGVNDYVINILNSSELVGMRVDSIGETSVFGQNPIARLTEYSNESVHPETPCFIDYEKIVKLYLPMASNPYGHPEYIIKNETVFFEALAHTCAHELYHAIIYRSLKYRFLLDKGSRYNFGVIIKGEELAEAIPTAFTIHMDSFGHNPMNTKDMSVRAKQYSLNTSGNHIHPFAYFSEINRYDHLGQSHSISINLEKAMDIFFVNDCDEIKISDVIADLSLNEELNKSINKLKKGSAKSKIDAFRNDVLHSYFVLPFLKKYKEKHSDYSTENKKKQQLK